MKFGLIGEKLAHSASPAIHDKLGVPGYELAELDSAGFEAFINKKVFSGVNVTMPYKLCAAQMCDVLSPEAERTGAVNTIVNCKGRLFGYNTDLAGFKALAGYHGLSFAGKKVAVLGGGATARTVLAAAEDMGALQVVTVCRSGPVKYENTELYCNADIAVNTTPIGMFPKNGEAPLSLKDFTRVSTVIDVIYNPLETALLAQAGERGAQRVNGLHMLVAQAAASAGLFLGKEFSQTEVDSVFIETLHGRANIVLTGMPGCGKSTVGRELSRLTGRELLDTDEIVQRKTGIAPEQIIEERGEAAFRRLERETVAEASVKSGVIIATGGGTPLSEENRRALRQNGVIVMLERDLSLLERDGRPLSRDIERLYTERRDVYEAFAHAHVYNSGAAVNAAVQVLQRFKEAAECAFCL